MRIIKKKSSRYGRGSRESGFGNSNGLGSRNGNFSVDNYNWHEEPKNSGFNNRNTNNDWGKEPYSFSHSTNKRRSRFAVSKKLIRILALAVAIIVACFLIRQVDFEKLFSGRHQGQPAAERPDAIQAAEPEAVSFEDGNRYFRRQLGGNYLTVYDQIRYGLQNHLDTIEFEIDNKEKLADIYRYVLWDYPELFWANTGYRYSYSTLKGFDSVSLSPNYELSAEKTQQRAAFVEERVANVAAQYVGLSAYEKVKGVYEYIVNNTVYDYNYSGKSACELFSDGRAVCEGYARAAQYILLRLGIEAVYTEGDATNSDGNSEGHAWLKVLIDGDYYNVDVTWGDPVNADGTQSLSYAYLCVTDSDISSSHVADPNPYPPCTATRCNYYVMENRMLSTYDEQLLLIWFSEDFLAGKKLEFRAIDNDVYRQTYSKLFDEDRYFNITSQIKGFPSGPCHYSQNDRMNVLSISY